MGIWDRIRGREREPEPVKAAVVGSGAEAERIAAAYAVCPGIELAGCEVIKPGDGVIRQPVVKPAALESLDEVIRTLGLEAIEVEAPIAERAALARACIKAGLFTTIAPPATREELDELSDLARSYQVSLRIRLPHLYYPPYREFKRLLDEDRVGLPLSLKLATRRGRGTTLPADLDPGQWIADNELSFLCLASWLCGPIAKVHARLEAKKTNGTPASAAIMWKYEQRRLYGVFQLDFCPDLHIRTATEPVHRYVELTGVGGLLIASRGEGQMLRMPALILRGKSTTTAFELTPDEWFEVYRNLARETVSVVGKASKPQGSPEVARDAYRLVAAARAASVRGDEVAMSA